MRGVTTLGLVLFIALFAAPATADPDFVADLDSFKGEEETTTPDWSGGASGNSPNDLWFKPSWGSGDDGERCYQIEVDEQTTDAAREGSAEPGDNTSWIDSDQYIDEAVEGGVSADINETLRNIGIGHIQLPEKRCPGNDPDDLMEVVWRSELCPPPPPSPLRVEPRNTALAGLPGYLEIGGDNPAVVTCLNEEITASARYVVHWGDGHTTETTTQGGPYPDGDVRHAYADKGNVEIVVEAYWRGEWRGNELGEVANPTTDSIDLTIEELRTARTGPS
jgi:hypothetical protein